MFDHKGLHRTQNSFVADEDCRSQIILQLTYSYRRPAGTIVGGYEVRSSRINDKEG